jgi:hypothetical protein
MTFVNVLAHTDIFRPKGRGIDPLEIKAREAKSHL